MKPPVYRAIIAGSVALGTGVVLYARAHPRPIEQAPVSVSRSVPSPVAVNPERLRYVIVYCRPSSMNRQETNRTTALPKLSNRVALLSIQAQSPSVDALGQVLRERFPDYEFRNESVSTTLLKAKSSFQQRGTLAGSDRGNSRQTMGRANAPAQLSSLPPVHYTLSGAVTDNAFELRARASWDAPPGGTLHSGLMETSYSLPKAASGWRYFCDLDPFNGQMDVKAGQHLIFVCAF